MKEVNKRNNVLNGLFWTSKGLLQGLVTTLLVSYLSFYATDVLGMTASTIAIVLLVTKLFDGVTDLMAGFLVDNTRTRWGKARPYDWCIPFIALFLILLFSAPKGNGIGQAIYIGFMYIMVQAVFVTIMGASDSVYLLRAFPDEKQRNSVFSLGMILGQILNIVLTIIIPSMVAAAGSDHSEWTRMVLILSIPLAAIGMIRFFTIKEVDVDGEVDAPKKQTDKKQKVGLIEGFKAIFENKYILILTLSIFIIVISSGFLNTSMAYYFKYIVGDQEKMGIASIGGFGSVIMLILFIPLANKFGKGRVMKVCLVLACVGNVIRWIGGSNVVTILIGMLLLMAGIVPLALYFPLYIFDIMDYGEWKTDTRVEGVIAVFPNFANKVAGGLAVSLGSFVLAAAGYDGTLEVQSAEALRAIDLTFNAIPTLIMMIMTVIMVLFYNIDKVMPQVKADLEERHRKEKENDGR